MVKRENVKNEKKKEKTKLLFDMVIWITGLMPRNVLYQYHTTSICFQLKHFAHLHVPLNAMRNPQIC